MKIIEGNFHSINKDTKIAIVASRFNDFITSELIAGAEDMLVRHGVDTNNIHVYRVPGAFEIPQVCNKIAGAKKHDAIIALGAVIRGSTPHFDYVSSEVSKGVAHVSLKYDIPVIFGVLTTDTIEQAIERAGTKAGNKGSDAALAALEMISVLDQI